MSYYSKYKLKFLITFIAFVISSPLIAQSSQFGRYIGTLTHERIQKQQLAKIDFVSSRNNDNQLELKAVLTLHFGDFTSGEYTSFHFNRVIFNLLTGSLVFDNPEEDVTLTTTHFGNGQLTGTLYSSYRGEIGELNLRLNQAAQPTLPLIEPVNGEYSGMCEDGNRSTMQLHTMRSTEDSSRVGNPFGSYELKGQFGKFESSMCSGIGPFRACQELSLNNSSYDFYSGELTLLWDVQSWSCDVSGDTINCSDDGGCTFTRTSNESSSRVFLPPQAPIAFVSDTDQVLENGVNGIAGEYVGYVHNEYLNKYQPININLITYQQMEDGQNNLRISATARLFFEDFSSNEFITYRFEPRDYPNILTAPQFVLSSLENDVDAFLKVTHLGQGVIRGEWNSLHFGRVGTFEAQISTLGGIQLPQSAQMLTSITSYYEIPDDNFDMDLRVFHGRTPTNSENPFFPLDIGGWFRFRYNDGGLRHNVSGGSYDFYTGKIGFRRGENQWAIGNRASSTRMNLRTISNVYGSVIQDFNNPRGFILSTNGPSN